MFKQKSKSLKLSNGQTDKDDIENATKLINAIFYPKLEKDLKNLNSYLETNYSVRVGVEINWFFEKIE